MKKELDELFQEFLYESEFVKGVRKETLHGYLKTFMLFKKLLPHISTDTLNESNVIEFFKLLQKRNRVVGKGIIKNGVKKSTIATYWSKLNCFFEWLHKHGHIASNPLRNIPYPTPSYDDRKFLDKRDVEKILTAIHVHHNNTPLIFKRNIVIFYLLLFCGLRREELLGLQLRDIDFEKRQITVRADTSKSGKSRIMPLHSTLTLHLKDFIAARKNYTTPYLIVSSNRDDKLSIDGLLHLVQKLRTLSGVRFHLHQFRHTFAVNFLKESNNIAKLKQLLGHKSIVMTLAYLRCMPVEQFREDIESLSIDRLI